MAKYVVDAGVVLYLLQEGVEPTSGNTLLAPTLIRSQILDTLYKQFREGELPLKDGKDLLARFSEMKVRYLGDKVLRRRAWEVAEELGWDSTDRAEYIALTQLQADAFITLDRDLARSVAGVVRVESFEALL